MRKSIFVILSGALLLALVVAPSAFACPTTWQQTIMEHSYNYVGSDCWWGGLNDNRMVTYLQVEKVNNVNLYQFTQECSGYVSQTFLSTVYSYSDPLCWQKTSSGCTGWKDWQPTPICSF